MDVTYLPENLRQVVDVLGCRIGEMIARLPKEILSHLHEIRIRSEAPLMITVKGEPMFITEGGQTCRFYRQGLFTVQKQEVQECFKAVCGYSLHTHQHEISEGFVVMQGGHRAGLAGTVVLDGEKVTGLRDITSMNIRVARQVKGVCEEVAGYLSGKICGLLIAGPPASGKTTLLRDLVRGLSSGEFGQVYRVTVIDERGELAASGAGRIGNDLGPSVDVLTGSPKSAGMLMAIRTLSPDVVVLDEIGAEDEVQAITQGLNAGAVIVGSIHAGNREELLRRKQFLALAQTGAFEKVAVLCGRENPCHVREWIEMGDLCAQIHRDPGDHFSLNRHWHDALPLDEQTGHSA